MADQEKREITVHPQIPSSFSKCPEPLKVIDTAEQYKLDPTGARSRLFSRANPERAGAGDILLVTFRTGEPFSGVCLSVRHRGPSTSILLRNTVTRVGTEMLVKVFSPLVQSIEVAQRAVKRPRRARLFYLRKPEKDMGSVQKIVDGYVRQRASLVGGKTQSTGGKQTQGKRGKASKR
ncbi:hypothetical protein BT93_L4497 [Corymbia citriodora subsp. variegata]|uniref:Ribosomal protein L19 n=1 Tax=Corymbia citriodora subsp. variegata TaxID=360336 RepID=A0A8T0CGV6_CORYI|nr:hypothetical protein BT93_L4497 [Corymbia citriodora subsp. variegata]